MLTPRGGSRIYLALRPVDLRKGFDGLAAQVQQVLQEDPFGGLASLSNDGPPVLVNVGPPLLV